MNHISKKSFIVIGCGGHAKVIAELLEKAQLPIFGFIDKARQMASFLGYPVLGDDSVLDSFDTQKYQIAIGIGFESQNMVTRKKIYADLKGKGFSIPTLVHPSAILARNVVLEEGCQVLSGAILCAESKVGENSIVNTGAQLDHETTIAMHCHIAPKATLCGKVTIESGSFIGAGSVVIQNIAIGSNIIVGAGSVVHRNLMTSGTYSGNPARKH